MTGVIRWIEPSWPALPGVRAAFSVRYPGGSKPPWDGLNLGAHVGDDAEQVRINRQSLADALTLPAPPAWLSQVHGSRVLDAAHSQDGDEADAVWSGQVGQVCAVMVADCLPVLLRDDQGCVVAAVHAGWRGLAGGVLQSALSRLRQHAPHAHWQAWLGPCIGPRVFEVGDEVRSAFASQLPAAFTCFEPSASGRWLADLQGLAEQVLQSQGVDQIWRTPACTYTDAERFFSFRRDGVTGRMAALIWRTR